MLYSLRARDHLRALMPGADDPLPQSAAFSHAPMCLLFKSMRFVPYQCHYHAVEVEEKHNQVKAELDERFLV